MLTVAPHLKPEEVLEHYRKAREAIEACRWLTVFHALQGKKAREIAQMLHRSIRWVRLVLARYNREGPAALQDRRHQNPGQKPKLTPEETKTLLKLLEAPPPDGGLWTGPKLQAWVRAHLGKALSLNPIYRFLKEAGFSLKTPRPRHRRGDQEAQEAFKKTLPGGGRSQNAGGAGLGLRRASPGAQAGRA